VRAWGARQPLLAFSSLTVCVVSGKIVSLRQIWHFQAIFKSPASCNLGCRAYLGQSRVTLALSRPVPKLRLPKALANLKYTDKITTIISPRVPPVTRVPTVTRVPSCMFTSLSGLQAPLKWKGPFAQVAKLSIKMSGLFESDDWARHQQQRKHQQRVKIAGQSTVPPNRSLGIGLGKLTQRWCNFYFLDLEEQKRKSPCSRTNKYRASKWPFAADMSHQYGQILVRNTAWS